jgi:predicted DCC family thiol-disulfide oxidoreductase YuxK
VSAVLFYDAECPACRAFTRLVLAADTERHIRTAPLDSPEADRLLAGLDQRSRMRSYHLVVDGRVHSAGEGIGALLEQVRLLRPVGRLVQNSPTASRTAAAGYRFLARHRAAISRWLPSVKQLPR